MESRHRQEARGNRYTELPCGRCDGVVMHASIKLVVWPFFLWVLRCWFGATVSSTHFLFSSANATPAKRGRPRTAEAKPFGVCCISPFACGKCTGGMHVFSTFAPISYSLHCVCVPFGFDEQAGEATKMQQHVSDDNEPVWCLPYGHLAVRRNAFMYQFPCA